MSFNIATIYELIEKKKERIGMHQNLQVHVPLDHLVLEYNRIRDASAIYSICCQTVNNIIMYM